MPCSPSKTVDANPGRPVLGRGQIPGEIAPGVMDSAKAADGSQITLTGSGTKKALQELLAAQRPDGGWSDLPSVPSSPYATGRSLVALQLGGLRVSDPAYQRGIHWLLTTQQEDGSWYTRTRALGFQPYFDAGFPHGYDQWMSAAGTSWAAMALTLALPEGGPLTASRIP